MFDTNTNDNPNDTTNNTPYKFDRDMTIIPLLHQKTNHSIYVITVKTVATLWYQFLNPQMWVLF